MIGFGSTGPIVGENPILLWHRRDNCSDTDDVGVLATSIESAIFGSVVGGNPVTTVAKVAMENRVSIASTAAKSLAGVFAAVIAAMRRWFKWKVNGKHRALCSGPRMAEFRVWCRSEE